MYPNYFAKTIISVLVASTLFSACFFAACMAHVHAVEYVAAKEVTCTENGNTEYYVCSCGKTFSDPEAKTEIDKNTTIITRKPHKFTVYGFDENKHYKKCAACGVAQSGTEGEHFLKYSADEHTHYRYCTLCDYRTESEAHVPDDEGEEFCKICRYRRPNYTLSDDGTYYICTGASQAFKDQITELVIPDTYLGLPVKEVGDRAFTDCPALEKITLGKNVVSVGDLAFMNNVKLKVIEFNEGLLEISYRAFYNCSALEELVLPNKLMNAGSGVFFGCTNLKTVTIPQSLKKISERMFYECYNLESIELHDGITGFGIAAFSRTGLSEFTVPEGVTAVPQTMFYDCKDLETVTLPESVVSIGAGAFQDCVALKKIIFRGSREQWDGIAFSDLWNKNTDFEIEFLQ